MKMCDCNQGRLPCTCKTQVIQQHQGEPVPLDDLRATGFSQVASGWNKCIDRLQEQFGSLFTHPDSGEVERLRASAGQHKLAMDAACYELEERKREIYALRAQLAERDALLSTAAAMLKECIDTGELDTDEQWRAEQIVAKIGGTEPIAPVERDERAEFERYECEDPDGPQVDPMWTLRCTLDPEKYGILSVQSDWETWQARAALERKS